MLSCLQVLPHVLSSWQRLVLGALAIRAWKKTQLLLRLLSQQLAFAEGVEARFTLISERRIQAEAFARLHDGRQDGHASFRDLTLHLVLLLTKVCATRTRNTPLPMRACLSALLSCLCMHK